MIAQLCRFSHLARLFEKESSKHCHPFYNHDGSVKDEIGNTSPLAWAMNVVCPGLSLIRRGLVLVLPLPHDQVARFALNQKGGTLAGCSTHHRFGLLQHHDS